MIEECQPPCGRRADAPVGGYTDDYGTLPLGGLIMSTFFSDLPLELAAVYETSAVNKSVELYLGESALHQDGRSWRGQGSLSFNWLPRPHLELCLTPASAGSRPKLEAAEAELVGLSVRTEGHVTGTPMWLSGNGKEVVKARIFAVISGSQGPYRRIRFHLPNFRAFIGRPTRTEAGAARAARLAMESDEWTITLDSIDLKGIADELPVGMGYAITHVGALERKDGSLFSLQDTPEIIECLRYFLSFSQASWVTPVLLCGEDDGGRIIGHNWTAGPIDGFKNVQCWLPTNEPVGPQVEEAFKGFAAAWKIDDKREALRSATEWYLEAATGGAARSLILAQAALELLSWTHSVQLDSILSADGWSKLPAADKIRVLLGTRSIPLPLPDGFDQLKAYANEFNIMDGPGAFVDMRNILVHADPKRRQRIKAHPDALIDARDLGLWYVELLLLNACGYNGRYSNRLIRGVWRGQEVQPVPWA